MAKRVGILTMIYGVVILWFIAVAIRIKYLRFKHEQKWHERVQYFAMCRANFAMYRMVHRLHIGTKGIFSVDSHDVIMRESDRLYGPKGKYRLRFWNDER